MLLKYYDSEYLGACIDTGNNVALLDNPAYLVEALTPYARSDLGMAAGETATG